ncbi:hypothetical protein BKA62DRAFT_499006 [Auriculariales sp. MPI-PUGE-AT-0066]|nr:hypothetical protein BKA62DRAFT_499006 [Auriculariales sp. MPI-PUGE-AT-0066]
MITVGLVAAFLFSLLPPATSIRGYQRISHATTTMEIGALYTSIVCHAHNPSAVAAQSGPIVMRLSALRSKLNRIHAMTRNTIYEISIQGAWPKERYHVLYEVQLELVALLSQLLSVVERLDPIWTRAFLRRTRFLDPEFLADVLACLTMISNALRTAKPLPHVTPVLLEQFSREQQRFGLLDARSVDDEDPSLPRVITFDTLQNQQYMYFCVGVASANAIVTRVDRLMIATKSLVGEHLQVYGLELPRLRRFGTYEGSRFSV